MHQAYLSLGSNIRPEEYLPMAVDLLQHYGEILQVSEAWESEAVGSGGPNFLNACILFSTPLSEGDLKEKIIHPIETKLGRVRRADKYAPRTIDIDVILFDDKLCNDKFWKQAFVVVPLAEIYPTYQSPISHESILEAAASLRETVWMETHPEVLGRYNGINSKS